MSRQQHIQQEEYPYLITTVIRGRLKFFAEGQWAGVLASVIRRACRLQRFQLFAFAIMPDHVHLIVYPNQAQASVPARILKKDSAGRDARAGEEFMKSTTGAPGGVNNLMHSIKSFFAHRVFELQPGTLFAWQQRYNSRILDTPKSLSDALAYVHGNAVHHALEVRYTKAPYVFIAKNIPL